MFPKEPYFALKGLPHEMEWGFVDIKRIDLGLNNGQGWFPNFSDAPPLLDKYLNIFSGNCGLASYWAARFGRFYFHQTPDLVSHWLEGFANCTPKDK
jgi:hypothetical protein